MINKTLKEMNQVVRDEIADKTLSFGCAVKILDECIEFVGGIRIGQSNGEEITFIDCQTRELLYPHQYTVIGHPPHIGHCMQWIEEEIGDILMEYIYGEVSILVALKSKRPQDKLSQSLPLPTEEPSEEWREVIEFLYGITGNHE